MNAWGRPDRGEDDAGEPWRRREDWASGRLANATGGRAAVAFLWLFTLVWNAMSWFAMIEVRRGNATGHTELAPLFPAIGVGLLAFAIYVTLQHRRWGRSWLELQTRPGVLGGPLRCIVHASPALAKAEALEVNLDCRGPEPGEGRIRLIQHLWHHEERVPRKRFELGEETRVPLAFRLPFDLPESDVRKSGDDPTWSLSASAKLSGVDYAALFELPVFRTRDSAPDEEGSRVEPLPLAPTPGSGSVPALQDSRIWVRSWGLGGREFVFGMLRNPWLGLLTAIFTLFFSGFVALIRYADGPGFFFVVFGLATLFLAYATVDTLFGVTRVRVEPGILRVRHGPFGVGPTRTLHLHEIESIRAVPDVQYGAHLYSKIRVELGGAARRPGKRAWGVTAGTRIPTQAEAEALIRAMRETLGL